MLGSVGGNLTATSDEIANVGAGSIAGVDKPRGADRTTVGIEVAAIDNLDGVGL